MIPSLKKKGNLPQPIGARVSDPQSPLHCQTTQRSSSTSEVDEVPTRTPTLLLLLLLLLEPGRSERVVGPRLMADEGCAGVVVRGHSEGTDVSERVEAVFPTASKKDGQSTFRGCWCKGKGAGCENEERGLTFRSQATRRVVRSPCPPWSVPSAAPDSSPGWQVPDWPSAAACPAGSSCRPSCSAG